MKKTSFNGGKKKRKKVTNNQLPHVSVCTCTINEVTLPIFKYRCISFIKLKVEVRVEAKKNNTNN